MRSKEYRVKSKRIRPGKIKSREPEIEAIKIYDSWGQVIAKLETGQSINYQALLQRGGSNELQKQKQLYREGPGKKNNPAFQFEKRKKAGVSQST